MKNLFFLFLSFGLFTFAACGDDDAAAAEFEYHAHIDSPAAAAEYDMGDTVQIKVNFEEHNGLTIHNINVSIYKKGDPTVVVFSAPANSHQHEAGAYLFENDFVLDAAAGITPDTDYVLEARVWGHDEGLAEESSTVEFHVHL